VGGISDTSSCPHYADLHIHSTYSDGTLTPCEIVNICEGLHLRVISIADHDTVDGIQETIDCAQGRIDVIPAIEMSSNIGSCDIHILGYFIDIHNDELLSYCEEFRTHRMKRVKRIISKLSRDGIKLEFEQIKVAANSCSLGRPHIAEVLVENGHARSINDAFNKYLGFNAPYYEPKKAIKPRAVIKKVLKSNGIPVIAHPGTIGDEQIIYQLIMDGCQGIEVWHPDHTHRCRQKLTEIAMKNGLLMTGGSDCHGRRGKNGYQIGMTGCMKEHVVELRKQKKNKARDGYKQSN
jgi:predicted metal-dependent phosphoesterase TrpH